MIGLALAKGKFLGYSQVAIFDTKSTFRGVRLDFLGISLVLAKITKPTRSFETELSQLVQVWADAGQATNLGPVAGDLARRILKLIYARSPEQAPLELPRTENRYNSGTLRKTRIL